MLSVQWDIAKIVADMVSERHEGDIRDPDGWKSVAEQQRCIVGSNAEAMLAPGQYIPADGPSGIAVIIYNKSLSLDQQARVLAHELAHHVMATASPEMFPAPPVHGYDDSPENIRHQIAQDVEKIIFLKCPKPDVIHPIIFVPDAVADRMGLPRKTHRD